MTRHLIAFVAFLCLPWLAQAQALEGTLKKIRDGKTVAIAYRTDALPFSSQQGGQPAGYSIDLCKRVVAALEQQLGVQPLAVQWVPATSQNRLELVQNRQADMECGSTTATFSRMERVDFSSPIFVDSTGLLVRRSVGARSFVDLGGKRIGVVAGTTNEQALKLAMGRQLVNATLVPVNSRDEGIAALEAGTLDAFASDKVLLLGTVDKVKDPSQYELLGDDLSFEQYAIVLPRGDWQFRLAVNRALAQTYRSDAIAQIFRSAFGPNARPTPGMIVMYGLASFPD
jgi:ABC-type amino acid transport substrate-binding protein